MRNVGMKESKMMISSEQKTDTEVEDGRGWESQRGRTIFSCWFLLAVRNSIRFE